ncbi:MAG: hypothetical protein ACI92Z_000610 [Paracoccaceae bacterium]|jgi:hypothetical protein
MEEIKYSLAAWQNDVDAANAEALRRAILTRDATEVQDRAAIWFSDLGALTVLPQELAEIDGLQRLIVGDAETPDGRRHHPIQTLSDISVLGNLPNLKELNLSDCGIGDLSFLRAMPQLEVLDLYGSTISDLSALSGLASLQSLSFVGTPVIDLSALSRLTSLQSLSFGDTQVIDLSALSRLASLQHLSFDGTQVSDLSALSRLTSLQSLSFVGTPVSDLSVLSGLASLQSLSFDCTPVSDLSALSGLASLQSLSFGGTPVRDLSPLLEIPAFSRLEAKALRFGDSPAAGLDRRWEMLAGISAKRAAQEVVLYLRGEHPDLQPPKNGAGQTTGASGMAAASPVQLVAENGMAEVADAAVFQPPVPVDPAGYQANLTGVHTLACYLVEELHHGANVDERLLRRLSRYSAASNPERAPVFAVLESAMVLIRPMAAEDYTRNALDAGLAGGLDHLVAQHDALGSRPALPAVLPELPNLPETPVIAAELHNKINDLVDVVQEAATAGMVGNSVVIAINSTVDVVNTANATPHPATPDAEHRRNGLWSWAIRMGGGLAQAMETYGKVHGWSATPAGAAILQKLAELVNFLAGFFQSIP